MDNLFTYLSFLYLHSICENRSKLKKDGDTLLVDYEWFAEIIRRLGKLPINIRGDLQSYLYYSTGKTCFFRIVNTDKSLGMLTFKYNIQDKVYKLINK